MQLNQISGSAAVHSDIQAQPGEKVQVLQHALGNFIELLSDPSSADRSHNVLQADRQILVSQQLLIDINANRDGGPGAKSLESVSNWKVTKTTTPEAKARPNRAFASDAERIHFERNSLLQMLDRLCSTLNTRGELEPGGCDANTEVGAAYRDASALVNQLRDY